MLEELARGIPGSFVVSRDDIAYAQQRREARLDAVAKIGQQLRQKVAGEIVDRRQFRVIDGGVIMGPGLDDVKHVIGVVPVLPVPPLSASQTSPPSGTGESALRAEPETRNPEPDSAGFDHRAYDAAVKAEAQKQEAAQAVAKLLQARKLIIEAWSKLSDRACGAMSQINFQAVAVGEKHTMLQFTTGDGVSIRIEWDRGLFN